MSIGEIVFLGIIQGITEWLPVSSSGHLVLFEKLLDAKSSSLEFDIFLHLASLLVIIIFFRKEIKKLLQNFWSALFSRNANGLESDEEKNWWKYIILSSVFTAAIGYFIYGRVEMFRNTSSVAVWLLVTAVLLFLTKFSKGEKNIRWYHAVILGIVQGIAVIPGLSRSGTVIAVALLMKIKKSAAFNYAFLVAIPAILGSFLLTIKHFNFSASYLIGFGVTILVGYLCLGWLKRIVKRDNLYLFFIYTLVLGLIIKLF